MRVALDHLNGPMPQRVGDLQQARTLARQIRGAGVAQVVKLEVINARGLERCIPVCIESFMGARDAGGLREYPFRYGAALELERARPPAPYPPAAAPAVRRSWCRARLRDPSVIRCRRGPPSD